MWVEIALVYLGGMFLTSLFANIHDYKGPEASNGIKGSEGRMIVATTWPLWGMAYFITDLFASGCKILEN